jgi:hypothetical protein
MECSVSECGPKTSRMTGSRPTTAVNPKKKDYDRNIFSTTKEIYTVVKNHTITETIRLQKYVGLDMYREWKKI